MRNQRAMTAGKEVLNMKLEIRSPSRAICIAGAFLAASSSAVAQISFQVPTAFVAGEEPHAVALADFDDDGDIDIAATVHNPARLALLRNDGFGVFSAPEFTTLATGADAAGIVARDFNGDGHMDVAIAYSADATLRYLRNLGDGDFVVGDSVVVGENPQDVAAADFDGDGDDDLVVSNRTSNTVSVVRNLGLGDFLRIQTLAAGVSPRGLAFGEFGALEGSFAADLAVVSHGSREVRIFHNDGTGLYVLANTLTLGGLERPEAVAVADIDQDGDDDLLVTLADTTVHDVGVFRQTSPGVFCQCDYYDVGGVHPIGIVAADFDLDTYVDVAAVNSTSSTIAVLRNLNGVSFGELQNYALLGPESDFVAAADLNGDHYLDLVATNDLGNSVSVLLNARDNPSSYCIGSPNSTGGSALIGSSGSTSMAANDFVLEVHGAPASVNGLFFLGQNPIQTPYMSGYLCIRPPFARLGPTDVTDAGGFAMHPLDVSAWPAMGIEAGSIWNAQFWYRDPSALGGATTNFSNGLRIVFDQ